MNFADSLKDAFKTAPARPSAKKALGKALLGLAGLAALPLLSGTASLTGHTLRMLVALGLACGLAFYVLRLLAKRSARSSPAELRVVARTALSQKNSLAIVEADGQRYFIAYGEGFTELLSSAPAHPVASTPVAPAA